MIYFLSAFFLLFSKGAYSNELDYFIDEYCYDLSDDECTELYLKHEDERKERDYDHDEYEDEEEDDYYEREERSKKQNDDLGYLLDSMNNSGFKDSEALNDKELLDAISEFMENNCEGIDDMSCATKFLSEEDKSRPDPSYKIYKKKRKGLIKEYKKSNPKDYKKYNYNFEVID